MSRCKACNEIMTDGELANTNDSTGEQDDLCFRCLGVAMDTVVELEEGEGTIITEDELDKLLGVD